MFYCIDWTHTVGMCQCVYEQTGMVCLIVINFIKDMCKCVFYAHFVSVLKTLHRNSICTLQIYITIYDFTNLELLLFKAYDDGTPNTISVYERLCMCVCVCAWYVCVCARLVKKKSENPKTKTFFFLFFSSSSSSSLTSCIGECANIMPMCVFCLTLCTRTYLRVCVCVPIGK